MSKWVVCHKGKGNLYKDNIKERLETNFDIDSVGQVTQTDSQTVRRKV